MSILFHLIGVSRPCLQSLPAPIRVGRPSQVSFTSRQSARPDSITLLRVVCLDSLFPRPPPINCKLSFTSPKSLLVILVCLSTFKLFSLFHVSSSRRLAYWLSHPLFLLRPVGILAHDLFVSHIFHRIPFTRFRMFLLEDQIGLTERLLCLVNDFSG